MRLLLLKIGIYANLQIMTVISSKNLAHILLLLLFSLSSKAQTMVFRMELFGDSVGVSTITKRSNNGIDEYTLDSRARAKVLWIVRQNHTHYESKFKDGKLISASYYEENNGKKDKWSYITFNGKEYVAENYRGKKTFTEAPTHSIGSIYCDPYNAGRRRFFNEAELDFNELKFPDANTIEFKSSDGNRNVYRFKNGQINMAEFHTSIATVYIKRIK
jgi:hypothetical protein